MTVGADFNQIPLSYKLCLGHSKSSQGRLSEIPKGQDFFIRICFQVRLKSSKFQKTN